MMKKEIKTDNASNLKKINNFYSSAFYKVLYLMLFIHRFYSISNYSTDIFSSCLTLNRV